MMDRDGRKGIYGEDWNERKGIKEMKEGGIECVD